MSAALDLISELASFDDALIALMTAAELAEYEQLLAFASAELARENEDDYETWLRLVFPAHFTSPFAAHQRDLWDWVWAIEDGVAPSHVQVAAWGRGGTKSTSAEAAVAAWGARRKRRYALYVCDLQRMADDHVSNIGALLGSKFFRMAYPELGRPRVSEHGNRLGWTRQRLRTADGFTVEGYGFNTSPRGLKDEEQRPDAIVLDEFDAQDDNPGRIEEKIEILTQSLLPAGATGNLAVLVIQNFVNRTGIMPRLCGKVKDVTVDYLQPRRVSGPIPALHDFAYEQREDGTYEIMAGTPTWEGQGLAECQSQINLWGISAFRKESLFDLDADAGGMFADVTFQYCTMGEVRWDDITRVAVWCDPAVTDNDNSDSQAVQCDALAGNTVYRLRSWEERSSPVTAIKVAVAFALRFGTRRVGIETDQGGDTWNSVYREAVEEVRKDLDLIRAGDVVEGPDIYVTTLIEVVDNDFEFPMLFEPDQEKAGSAQTSKAGRAQQMLGAYETTATQIVHVLGTHAILDAGLRRFGKRKPFDLADAAYWTLRDLIRLGGPARGSGRRTARAQLPAPTLIGAR